LFVYYRCNKETLNNLKVKNMKNIELNKTYTLDVSSLSPIIVLTKEFTTKGVKVEYLNSWEGRIELLSWGIWEYNGYEKLKLLIDEEK